MEKKKILFLIVLISGAVIVGGGVFWVGKKFGEKKEISTSPSQKITELEQKNKNSKTNFKLKLIQLKNKN